MQLSKQDTQIAKGIAIIGMVMLHLFCRLYELPYTPLINIGNTPLIYYFGLFGDLCVPIFCFCSGYAHDLIYRKDKENYIKKIPNKLLRFLLNYWIVVIVFSILGLFFDKSGTIPGSFKDFLGNFFLVGMNYNGAWWFVITYIFLLILSPVCIMIVDRVPSAAVLILSFGFYVLAYFFRFSHTLEINNVVLNWLLTQLVLIGTSQFTYIVGMLAHKYSNNEFLKEIFNNTYHKKLKVVISALLIIAAFVGHAIIQSVFVAPFTALMVLVALYIIDLPEFLRKILLFFGKHSTNIWLVHMFFYLTLFKNFVFIAKYPVLILLLMLAICVAVSYVINIIYNPLCKVLKK